MSDNTLRHIVAICITLICGLAYYAGWVSRGYGWWWTSFSLLIIYGIVYKLINSK